MRAKCKRKTRGAASVEAVVALPVFIILFIGMFYLRELTGARLAADQEARRCSWEYALTNNCAAVPVGCENVVGRAHYGGLMPDMDKFVQGIGDGMGSVGASCSVKAGCSVGSKAVTKVKRVLQNFVLDYLAKAVSIRFDANKGVEIHRPGLLGGGTGVVSGRYGMGCNIAGRDQNNVADLLWDEFGP